MSLGFQAPDTDPEDSAFDCKVDSGFHAAITDRNFVDKDGKLHLVWRFTSDPWKGHVIDDKYSLPAYCMRQEDMADTVNRYWLLLYRLGLVTKEQRGKPITLESHQLNGITRVLEIQRGPGKKDPSKIWSNVKYGCIWALDRPEIPAADRIRLGLPLLPGQPVPAPAASGHVSTPAATGAAAGASGGPKAPPPPAFDPSEVV